MDGVYEPKDNNGLTAIVIFLIGFFLIGMAALLSFLLTNKTVEYKIENKTYTVYGRVKDLEELIGETNIKQLILLGVEDFQEIPNKFDNKSITIKTDNKIIVVEFDDKTIKKIYNLDSSKVYYDSSNSERLYNYIDDTLKLNDGNNSSEDGLSNNAPEQISQEELAKKTKTLFSGTYVVGKDILEGTYNLHALSGNGNLVIRNSDDRLKLNELFGVGNEYSDKNNVYLKDINNVILEKDYTITIGTDMKIKFNAVK